MSIEELYFDGVYKRRRVLFDHNGAVITKPVEPFPLQLCITFITLLTLFITVIF